MPVSIPDFWTLLVASRLASRSSIPKLQEQFSQVKGADTQGNVVTLAQWLISQGTISRYQAKVLLAGHAGPFAYGDYTVFDRHGEGRLQGAFRALHPATRHRVLLWFHSGAVVQNPQWWAILTEQVGTFGPVVDSNVARVYHLCDIGQFKFTVLEDLQGEAAEERLRKGPLPWAAACRMIRQVAKGLTKLFELGQMHGAIRPHNVWIDEQENAKLLLPPVARDPLAIPGYIELNAPDPSGQLNRQADYLAPEMARPGQAQDSRTEVYALGCTLFHLIAGKPPFRGRDPLSKLASHAGERIPSLESAGVPALVDQALTGMMAKDPDRRYQHPRQVADVLTQLLEKLEPAQLKWRASAISNKLPEYEAWLQPYRLAPESAQNEIPEISMPPILAAGLQSQQHPEPTDMFISLGSASPQNFATVESQAGRPAAVAPARPAAARPGPIGPASPVRPRVPPPMPARPTSPSAPTDQTGPTVQSEGTSAAIASTAPRASAPAAEPSAKMVFPPDDADFMSSITAQPRRKPQSVRQKSTMLIGVMSAVCLALAIVLWLTLRHHFQANSPEQAGGPGSATTNDAGATAAISGNKDGNQGEAAGKRGTEPTSHGDDAKDAAAPAPAGRDGENKGSTKGTDSAATKGAGAVGDPPGDGSGAKPTADDGKILWASPTSGARVSVANLPAGAQIILFARPAELMRNAEADKILAALGPEVDAARRELESITASSMADIEQLTVAWPDAASAPSAPFSVVQFARPLDSKKLLSSLGQQTDQIGAGLAGVVQTPQGPSIFSPPTGGGKVLLVGPNPSIEEAAKSPGEAPPLRREIEKLLTATDSQRLVTLVWIPGAVGGDLAANGPWARLVTAARSFFGEGVRAASLSAHLTDENLFLELRVLGAVDRSADAIQKQMRERVEHLALDAEAYLAGLNLQPYGRQLLLRFPQMLRVMAEFTRTSVEGDQIVMRCYLPVAGAHNLLAGTELALAEGLGSAGADAAARSTAGPETIAQRLKRITSLNFARDTLENAVRLLAEDVGVKYEILGPDLQLEGITKNQSFGLDEKNKPADEILRNIMLKANPDGKLVYVVKPKQPGGDEVLLITTRAAAAKRGDTLPSELAAAPPKR
jgi:serine/threonine protein kinase